MPPAAKKQKLKQTTIAGGESKTVRDAVTRCKRSREYAETLGALTLVEARKINRRIGTAKWYRLNKDALVALLVLHRFVLKIQRFFRMTLEVDGATPHDHSEKEEEDHANNKVCPISLVAMSEIPRRRRFVHTNTWFDKEVLAQHMSKTSDFVNPVTRVDFREEDVRKIDPGLLEQFKNRKELRSSIAQDMAIIQSMENELEEVFQDMVEAAEEIPSRIEFRIVFDNLAEDFYECHDDLVELDVSRSNLAIKSLRDLISGDPNNPVRMSRKRETILRHFLDNNYT